MAPGDRDDPRVLPTERLGVRRFRSWDSILAVLSGAQAAIPDFEEHFEGPAVIVDLARTWASHGGVLQHVRDFFREMGMAAGSGHRHEMVTLAIAIEMALSVDQLRPGSLLCLEVMGRRLSLMEFAYESTPRGGTPDFTMATEWMGLKNMRIGAAVHAASTREHVADRLGKKALILKEARKAAEEMRIKKKGAAARGGKDGGGADGGADGG